MYTPEGEPVESGSVSIFWPNTPACNTQKWLGSCTVQFTVLVRQQKIQKNFTPPLLNGVLHYRPFEYAHNTRGVIAHDSHHKQSHRQRSFKKRAAKCAGLPPTRLWCVAAAAIFAMLISRLVFAHAAAEALTLCVYDSVCASLSLTHVHAVPVPPSVHRKVFFWPPPITPHPAVICFC